MTRAISLPFYDLPTAPDGLALEMEMLAHAATSEDSVAFLWQSRTPWLVLPDRFARTQIYDNAAQISAARGWPVAPRKTGGGITPQGPGVLNLALAFTADPGASRSIRDSYAQIVDPLTDGLATLGVTAHATPVAGSFCDGDFNLAVEGRKLVGTAQRWRGRTCLIHALLLTDIKVAPAVNAVAGLSQNLGHDTTFTTEAHCRLADLLETNQDLTQSTTTALWQAVSCRGYAPYAPQQ